jgi:hypothetical protein
MPVEIGPGWTIGEGWTIGSDTPAVPQNLVTLAGDQLVTLADDDLVTL